MKLEISEPSTRSAGAILIIDTEGVEDIAEFFHNEHSSVAQSYETALALAQNFVQASGAPNQQVEAVAWQMRTRFDDSDVWGDWESTSRERCERIQRSGKVGMYPAEARPLYATSPSPNQQVESDLVATLDRIVTEYPVNHGSKFCKNLAEAALRWHRMRLASPPSPQGTRRALEEIAATLKYSKIANSEAALMVQQIVKAALSTSPAPAEDVRASVIEECATALANWYPDNASTNAFCAAIRSLTIPDPKQAMQDGGQS